MPGATNKDFYRVPVARFCHICFIHSHIDYLLWRSSAWLHESYLRAEIESMEPKVQHKLHQLYGYNLRNP